MTDESPLLAPAKQKRLAPYVYEFWQEKLKMDNDPIFTDRDLRDWLSPRVGYVPTSPQRTLLLLRKQGRVNYALLSRKRSEYKALAVDPVAFSAYVEVSNE